jgi:ribonuclease HI
MINNKIAFKVAGAERVILDPRGNQVVKYAWSLGHASNNQAKEYALIKGVQLAKGLQLQHLIIIGDSKNTIRYMIKGTFSNAQLSHVKKKKVELKGIPHTSFIHVKRENNKWVDSEANYAIKLSKGAISICGSLSQHLIP